MILTRKSAQKYLDSPLAQQLLEWCKDVVFPEEIIFATLVRVDLDHFDATGQVLQGI